MSSAAINDGALHGVGETPFVEASSISGSFGISFNCLDPRVVSGSVGSVVSSVVSQPFEVAKVKLQNSDQPRVLGWSKNRAPGTFSVLRHVMANQGVRGVYAGLAPTMVMSIPNYALYLTAYDEIVSYLRTKQSTGTVLSNDGTVPLVGGAVARLIATTAVAPLEMLRTRNASQRLPTRTNPNQKLGLVGNVSVWNDLKNIVRKEGIVSLYTGILPSLGRDVPFAAVYMLCLERIRDESRRIWMVDEAIASSPRHPTQLIMFEFINAAMAGMVAATATAPMDVLKTRAQSAIYEDNTRSSSSQNRESTMRVLRSIVRTEGVSGLWRGNQARMMKVAPQYAIMISFYEVGKKMLAE
ncbi:25 member 40 [Seminavis robusta]|uniref:25 member 40 n=1 Tax=Seminavis robusta TaxID=568900 RepID=A0A9N8E2F0_9STRA|nr:25 member 40 [Seminavis robusta]|eukprot:Sro581_g170290.1 25 member 40 (355) ;mRNA; f:29961-31025